VETPQQQVVAYLKDHAIPQSRQLQVSLLFAESMVLELQGAVDQWQVMLGSIRRAERELRGAATHRN